MWFFIPYIYSLPPPGALPWTPLGPSTAPAPTATLFPISAFDTVDHRILIQGDVPLFGCSGTVLGWFISYKRCRTQSGFVGHESTPICSAMWSAAVFCSGTSSVYSVYIPSKNRYLSVRSFIQFLCR